VPWSFGSARERLFAAGYVGPRREADLAQMNARGAETAGPQGVTVPNFGPVAPLARRVGKRAWPVLAQWEGVVKEVSDESFLVRLTPLLAGGRPDFTRIEFAEFGFDELAYEAEQALIAPTVWIYWTVGRRKDEFGTVFNESFVRIRRSTEPSVARRRIAAAEVAEILADAEEARE